MNLKEIKGEVKEIKKDIMFFLDIEKTDMDSIPAMRYSKGVEPSVIKPMVQYAEKNSRKISYRR